MKWYFNINNMSGQVYRIDIEINHMWWGGVRIFIDEIHCIFILSLGLVTVPR